jgi:hypothetical protein
MLPSGPTGAPEESRGGRSTTVEWLCRDQRNAAVVLVGAGGRVRCR